MVGRREDGTTEDEKTGRRGLRKTGGREDGCAGRRATLHMVDRESYHDCDSLTSARSARTIALIVSSNDVRGSHPSSRRAFDASATSVEGSTGRKSVGSEMT